MLYMLFFYISPINNIQTVQNIEFKGAANSSNEFNIPNI